MKLKSVARQYKLDYRSERKSQPVEVVKSSTYHKIVLSLKLGDIMLHINRCEMMACAPLTYAADRMWPLNFMKTCYYYNVLIPVQEEKVLGAAATVL